MLLFTLFATFLWVLIPADAFAWGPGMHLDIALTMLEKVALAAPVIRPLITAFPQDFVYGAVSPDIFMKKQLAGMVHHCHNWRMGMLLLSEAETDRQRASAYGYLVHLAADVVAHNYFIPYKVVHSFHAKLLSHTYWELRFDLTVPPRVWPQVRRLLRGNFREFDHLLERVMKKTLFSFKTSKRIYYSILVVQRLKRFRRWLKLYARKSQWELPADRVAHYRKLVFQSVGDFWQHVEKARCFSGDPTGLPRERGALAIRKELQESLRKGLISEASAKRYVRTCRDALEAAIFEKQFKWPKMV